MVKKEGVPFGVESKRFSEESFLSLIAIQLIGAFNDVVVLMPAVGVYNRNVGRT